MKFNIDSLHNVLLKFTIKDEDPNGLMNVLNILAEDLTVQEALNALNSIENSDFIFNQFLSQNSDSYNADQIMEIKRHISAIASVAPAMDQSEVLI